MPVSFRILIVQFANQIQQEEDLNRPAAVEIASGMSIGSVFTLFIVPAMYTLMARQHQCIAVSSAAVAHAHPSR